MFCSMKKFAEIYKCNPVNFSIAYSPIVQIVPLTHCSEMTVPHESQSLSIALVSAFARAFRAIPLIYYASYHLGWLLDLNHVLKPYK